MRAFFLFFQNPYFKKPPPSGQAIVEYVLILTVVVVIMGGLLLKFNQEVQKWGKSIISGDNSYVACLMQTGKLPGQVQVMGCAIEGMKFDADLSANTGGGSGGSSGSSSDGSSSSGNKAGAGDKSKSSSQSDENSSNAQGSSSTGGSSSGGGSSKGKKRGRARGQSSSGQLMAVNSNNSLFGKDSLAGQGSKDGDLMSGGGSGRKKSRKKRGNAKGFAGYNRTEGDMGQRYGVISSYGIMEGDEQKKRKAPIPVASGTGGKKNAKGGHSDKKTHFVMQELKKKEHKEIDMGGWSFGKIFRLILIICVLAGVALVVGSQARSAQKGSK